MKGFYQSYFLSVEGTIVVRKKLIVLLTPLYYLPFTNTRFNCINHITRKIKEGFYELEGYNLR